MATVTIPTTTDSVLQYFFIEALAGAQNPISYLDRFPETVYTKAVDSLLVRFLYALLGPVGVGQLRQDFLKARLQVEEAGLQTADLDSLYTSAVGFARLAEETYDIDASTALLPAKQRATIIAQDASFRNRAQTFLRGARAGGTVLGLTLASTSGLDRPTEVIENYLNLYDRYTDRALGLSWLGTTNLPNEAIVVPRQLKPRSAVQTLTITGDPLQGWFTLTFPTAQPWSTLPVATTAGSSTIDVGDIGNFPAGVFVTLTSLPSTSTLTQLNPQLSGWHPQILYAQSAGGTGNTVSLVYPASAGAQAGQPALAPSTGNFVAYVGVGQTGLLSFDSSAGAIRDALMALPGIGTGNVAVSGGPLPDQPVTIQFAHALSDQVIPTLQANTEPDKVTGVTATGTGGTEEMSDNEHNPLTVAMEIATTTTGISADGQSTTIAPIDEHAMRDAVDRLRPMTALVTSQDGEGKTRRQAINSSFGGSTTIEVVRYVTGRSSLRWPPRDDTHWIESAREHEAPKPFDTPNHHYRAFHNIAKAQAYTEAALADPTYQHPTVELGVRYWDTLIGHFSQAQQALVPALASLNRLGLQFLPTYAIASQAEPLVLNNVSDQAVINGIYPADYLSLPGVVQPTGGNLWASAERTEGTDYLEIDLGKPQAVNYLYFEATRKPYQIAVAYDTLDQAPARSYVDVTIAPLSDGASTTSLSYDATLTNAWETVEIFFTNNLDNMIYTRFLRIGFERAPTDTPFATPTQGAQVQQFNVIPYSIEVRNLRAGRNVPTS